jgi:hypothetical protein
MAITTPQLGPLEVVYLGRLHVRHNAPKALRPSEVEDHKTYDVSEKTLRTPLLGDHPVTVLVPLPSVIPSTDPRQNPLAV